MNLPAAARNSKEASRITQIVEALGWPKGRKLIEGAQLRAFFNLKEVTF
jgi:hypothetical protein